MTKLPKFIPIVTPQSLRVFQDLSEEFEYAVIPYYTLISPSIVNYRLTERVKWILSSIMPDELLLKEDTHILFRKTAEELGVHYVLVWDMPTYLENKEESLRNTYISLSKIEFFLNEGFKIIPLIKGAYEEHIRISASQIFDWGFKTVAFHISDYLTSSERPWPHIEDYSLSSFDLMMRYINLILGYDFDRLLLVGGASPRYAFRLLEIDDRIILAGYSWYLDAEKRRIYDLKERYIVNIEDKEYECNCPYCVSMPPKVRRKSEGIARHNLYLNKIQISSEDISVDIQLYDLIADYSEDIVITGELSVGGPKSKWRSMIKKIYQLKPDYLIVIGRIFDFKTVDEKHIKHWREFIEILTKLHNDYNLNLISVYRYPSSGVYRLLKDIVYPPKRGERPNVLQENEADTLIARIIRMVVSSRSPIIVKKWYGGEVSSTFTIQYMGVAEQDFDISKNELRDFSKDTDWLICDYINRPYIDYQNKIGTPGIWDLRDIHYIKSEPGLIHIKRNGDIELIKN